MTGTRRAVIAVAWIALAAPAIYQLVLLVTAISGRIAYPYDLEWMEGGLLHHAQRLADGHPIYAPPSVDFIPYLYTPFYPALLGALGKVFGLGYTLGRAISVLALVGFAAVAAGTIVPHGRRGPAWCGVALGLGIVAAVYPYMEGWYDLVRADTLFVLLVTGGLALAARATSHMRAALAAVLLVLAFFTKQTGIFYAALGGGVVLVQSWRRAATYTVVAAALGTMFAVALNLASDGWFWIYVSKIHRAHDFNMPRFWKSYGQILWHFPAVTVIVAVTLVAVLVTRWRRRKPPAGARPFVLWTAAFAVSTVVGAVGWGTEFARFNAYMPAFMHGALAAAAALPALAGCAEQWWPKRLLVGHAVAATAAVALGVTLVEARWEPAKFLPTEADASAGDRLIARIAAIDGDVWMPSHPWYVVLAGKSAHVHRMGVTDVTRRQARRIAGMDESLRTHAFAAIVLDNRDVSSDLPALGLAYRPALKLPPDERPRLYTGAGTFYDPWGCCLVPDAIWLPATPATPPAGAKVVFDFESATWGEWLRSGPAWGNGPASEAQPGQELVIGATGQRFATSMHGGDATLGRITSPVFPIDGVRITLRLGGGTDATKLRAELWVDGVLVRTAGAPLPGGETLREVRWDVAELRGKQAKLVLVDDSPSAHLDVDDVWMWSN